MKAAYGLLALVVALAPVQAADLAPTGTLRASFIADNPNQGRVDPQTKEVTGPAPDLVQELARRLGVQYEILPLPSAGAVLESVRSGQVDIGFLAYEPARATQVDYSDDYSVTGSTFAVRADSALQRTADVDRAGITVAAVRGQSQETVLRETLKAARLESLPAVPPGAEIVAMLSSGQIDAFGANRTRMETLVSEFPGLRVLPDDFAKTTQAIVVQKGKALEVEYLNEFLTEMRASGFVQTSLERANLAGVSVAPATER
jgi:polar amino acid transport system substrate-binding protein